LPGEREAGWFLEQTLDEEKEADAKLTQLAKALTLLRNRARKVKR
jgi:ferritin-like metal-binding protein YciE